MNIAQQFLIYANRIDSHKRAEMTSVLAKAYATQNEPHPEQENVLLALTAMAADPAHEVRRALSEVVASSNQFPRPLHVALSKDMAAVAEPIFARSKVLSDAELLAGLANNNQWVQCAIAGRIELSPLLVEALAKNASSVAVLTLLRNPECQLTLDASETIWQRFQDQNDNDHKHVMLCLLRRPDVSAFVKLKIDFLGEVSGEPPLPNLKTLERRLDQILQRTAQAEAQELPHIARFLLDRQWLNTVVIIRAAMAGQFAFTAALLAQASGIKSSHALRLCRMGGFGLRALCRYAGLSKNSGQLLAGILDEAKSVPDGQALGQDAVSRVIKRMEAQGATMQDVLYCMMLQLEAKLLIDNAQQIRYDLALKAIVEPEMPEPSQMQDEVAEKAASSVVADTSQKIIKWPIKTTGTSTFGAFSSGTLAYKTLSA